MKRFKALALLIIASLLVLSLAGCGQKQQSGENKVKYPEKSINVIVGFSAGGPTDLIARGIMPIVQEKLGVGVGITNVPGAASATGANQVLSQPKDGYTLFFGSEAMSTWQVMGTADMSPTRDFVPVKVVAQAIPVLAVPPNSKFKTVEEFINYAKQNPGKLRISTAGPATVPHVSGLLLEKELGVKFTYVPYEGGRPAITAAMGGQVDATIEMVQSMVEAHRSGQIRILASLTNEPVEGLEVPAIGAKYPELAKYLPYGPYFGLFVPKGTPDEVVDVLKNAMDEAVKDSRWLDYCKKLYLIPIDYSGDEAVKFIDDWTAKAAWILYDAGVAKESPEKFGIKRPNQ
ncbi:Tripartite-type tricarboxylate transporter, receptor component TctC [Caldanaerovirga acetigignens]|uniref:Tripartite-type tricarboxylate transporter, receptor component TctC n=1 Tax=Caldanaerovirga acetigignens TaxID=447595 RepID=A0A1M7I8H6_9FIRM|nr:tripartite tricarboxylate transporter substrate binding protein [Caldanaerovirga acetigignens]SHM36948.1 Tripartite-type tricarboxylate transporter, receptor component TctC [Caldanaerovirga acetigignens]